MAKELGDQYHIPRLLLDHAYAKCLRRDYESAQQMWGLSSRLAEQVNDWSTAAKAAKQRCVLLGASDTPSALPGELDRCLALFRRAADAEGVERTQELVTWCRADFIRATMLLGGTREHYPFLHENL